MPLPPASSGSGPLPQLALLLREAGYSRELAAKFLSPGVVECGPELTGLALRSDRLAILLRLFAAGLSIPLEEARDSLSPIPVEALVGAGLLEVRESEVRSATTLTPFGDIFVAWDFPRRGDRRGDRVLGIGHATLVLAALAVRRPNARALDIGTGQGFQAMLAAGHCSSVVATDLNPHALDMARLGAGMNGLTNIEFRHGSFFEPVVDERFDLLVCNPPFVISPPHDLVALGGVVRGDRVAEEIVRGAPGHLVEGGYATILGSWQSTDEASWTERVREWVKGSSCDAWAIRLKTQTPLEYAEQWIGEYSAIAGPDAAPPMDRWVAYLNGLGIGAITFAALVLRRRGSGSNWFRADTLRFDNHPGQGGGQIERIFENQTALNNLDTPRRLLELRLSLTAEHQVIGRLRRDLSAPGTIDGASIRQTDGFEMPVGIDPLVAELLARLDGKSPARDAIKAVAGPRRVSPDRLAERALPMLLRLVELGFLTVRGH